MSVRVMSLVFAAHFGKYIEYTNSRGKPARLQACTAKIVLLAYADHANDEGIAAYPSISLLERKTGLSRRAVVNAIRALVQAGFLVPIGKSRIGTGEYAINLDALAKCVPQGADDVVNQVHQYNTQVVNQVHQGSEPGALKPSINHPIKGAPNGAGNAGSGGAERDGAAGQTRPKHKRKARTLPEPIAVYRRWTHLYPPRSLWDELTTLITDTERWERVVKSWVASGWNPRNVAGMLEFYQRSEVPGTARSRQSHAQPERPAPRDAREVLKELGL